MSSSFYGEHLRGCRRCQGLLLALIRLALLACVLDDWQIGQITVDVGAEHVGSHAEGVAAARGLGSGVVLGQVFDGEVLARLGLADRLGGGSGYLVHAFFC